MTDPDEPGRLRRGAAWAADRVVNGPDGASTPAGVIVAWLLWWRTWVGTFVLVAPFYLGAYVGFHDNWLTGVSIAYLGGLYVGQFVRTFWRFE